MATEEERLDELGVVFDTSVGLLIPEEDVNRIARGDRAESFGVVFDSQPAKTDVTATIDKTFKIAADKEFDQLAFTNNVLDMPSEEADPDDVDIPIETGDVIPFFGDLIDNQDIDLINSLAILRSSPFPPKFKASDTQSSFIDKQIAWMEANTTVEDWVTRVQEDLALPTGIVSEPVGEEQIELEQAIERADKVDQFIRENPEVFKALVKAEEDELIKTFLAEKGEPKAPSVLVSVFGAPETTVGLSPELRRSILLKRAKEHELDKREEAGEIEPRRISKGFFSEFGRSLLRSGLKRTSQVLNFVERITGPASLFEPGTFSDLSAKAKKASEKKSLSVGKGTPIRSFAAAAIADGISFTGATVAATLTGGPIAGLSVAFVVEGEAAFEEIIAAGGTEDQATWGMLIVGGINAGLEQLRVNQIINFGRGGAKTSFKSVADAVRDRTLKKLTAVGKTLTKDLVVNAASESIQEILQETTSIVVPAITGVKLATFEEAVIRITKAGAGGLIAGPVVGGGGAIATALVESGFSQDRADIVEDMLARGATVDEVIESAKKPMRKLAEAEEVPTEPPLEAPAAATVAEPTQKGVKVPTEPEKGLEIAKPLVRKIDRTSETAQQETAAAVAEVKALPVKQQKTAETQSISKVKERISFKKPKVKLRQRFKNLLFKADKAFRDEFAALRRAVNAADVGKLKPADDPVQLAVAFTQKSSAKTRGFVMEATTDLAGNRKSKGLKQIFTHLIKDGGKKRFEDFVTYLVAARDLNLQKQNKETGIDPVAAQLTFDALDSPEFAQAAREVTEWNQKGIDLLVESGRITRESGEAIKLANPIYAPFFREFEEEPGITRAKGKKFVPKKLKGSKRKIIDPIEGMIQQMEATISSAQRAAIERSLANLATQNPEALEDFITTTRAPVIPTKFTVEEIKAELEEVGIDFSGVADEDLNELLTVFRPSAFPATQGVIKLKVEGKDKFFKVEKELLDVLEGTEIYKLGPFWDIVIGKPTRILKLGATGLNAAFGLIRNPARDIQTFTVTSEFAKAGPFSAISGVLKDIKTKASGIAENFGFNSIKPSSDVAKFAALGGEMSGFITQDRAGTKHIQHDMLASNGIRYTINTFSHPIDVLRNLVSITEIGVRVGEFSAALKEGEKLYGKGSLSASIFALNAAQDVTTNFTRHGQIGKQINQVIPFFNVAIQGPDKIIRSFIERPLKSTVAAVSTLTIPAIFFWWRNKDKPWYRNMTAHEKANYIHFEAPNDETTVIRFPVPFELGHVFQAIPVAFLDAVHNNRPEEVKEILAATLKTAVPWDWPSLIGPIIDIKANEDFAGRPIVSRANEGKLPEDQFGPRTTELMKVIGKVINMSPSQIEHMVNSYSGGIYNRVARILRTGDVEKQPGDLPVIGTLFVRDPFAPRKQVQDFYKEREELNKKFQSKKITIRDAIRRVVINNIASVMNVSFDKLKEAKTTEERKKIWSEIGRAIELVDKLTANNQRE